jgi:hypothetical protein
MLLTVAQVQQLNDEQLLLAFEANTQRLQRLHRELEETKQTEKLLLETIIPRYREIAQKMATKDVAIEGLKTSLRGLLEVLHLNLEGITNFEGFGKS